MVATPKGVLVQMTAEEWRAVLKRDVEWQAVYAKAKKCKVP